MHRLKTEIINKKKISKTESNISACWLIPKSIALNDNAPGIILIGKFYKPIIHKGAKLRDANLDI